MCDVLLGMPWHYDHKAIIDTFEKTITITNKGKVKVLNVKTQGDSVPAVSASTISSIMKSHLSAYLIFVKEPQPVTEGSTSKLEKVQSEFYFSLLIVSQNLYQMNYLLKGLKTIQ